MESDASSRSSAPPPAEWRALSRLRERVEETVREVARLRAQNDVLAGRVAELQGQLDGGEAPAFALGQGTDPAALRATIEGFIGAIDEVLAGSSDGAGVGGDGADSTDLDGP